MTRAPGSPGLPAAPEPSAVEMHLGWQYAAPQAEPGPPPRRPVPPERQQLSADWLAAQRREEKLISRPLKLGCAAATAALIVLAACVAAGWLPVLIAAPAIAACLVAAALTGFAIWQGERALRARIRAERLRVEQFRADQESRLFAWQAEHARQLREWQSRRLAFESQKRWYAVALPAGIDRVDVAGGTLPGWSALLTMTAAHQLAAGGEVTVLDLSGGAVAADLLQVARGGGIEPAVWVLPADLPRLDLAASLDATDLADVIALSVAVSEERGSTAALAIDTAILERVIGVLGAGGGVRLASVTAALRALAQVGDPRADVAAGLLTEQEMSQLSALFGQGATDRVVLERALSIEAQLRKLAATGSEPIEPPRSRLRVVAIDKRVGPLSARLLGSFVVTALTHLLGQAEAGPAMAAHAVPARRGTAPRRRPRPAHRRLRELPFRAGARLPVDAAPGPAADRQGERVRGVHAAGQRGGREGRRRADRDRTPLRPLPAHRDRRDVGDGHDRCLLHEHGRRVGLAGYLRHRQRIAVPRRRAVPLGAEQLPAVRRRFVPLRRDEQVARVEPVGIANRRNQHEHGVGTVDQPRGG